MKKTLILLTLFLVSGAAIARHYPKKALLLLYCEGNETVCRDNPRPAQIFSLREEVESLIREGILPIVVEYDRNIVWVFLNPMPKYRQSFKSDYYESDIGLFPIKIHGLKKKLRNGNGALFKALGISYVVEGRMVRSVIATDKFEHYVPYIKKVGFWCQLFIVKQQFIYGLRIY